MKQTLLFTLSLLIYSITYSQFTFSAFREVGDTSVNPQYITVGDVNNDGYDDILVAIRTTGGFELFINDLANSNTFIKKTITNTLQDTYQPAFGDINDDGNIDIIAAGATNSIIAWYPNDGNGNFTSENIISSTVSGPTTVVVGDIDNNGTLDVATSAYGESAAVWFSNTDGAGTFSSMITIGGITDGGPFDLDLGDFDGDGDLDAVVGYFALGSVEVYSNNLIGSGTVSFTKYTNTVSTGSQYVYDVLFADVNDDNSLDIVLSDFGNSVATSTGDILYFTKNTNTISTSFNRFALVEAAAQRPGSVIVDDFTGDGYNDVVYVESSTGSVFGFESTNAGEFKARELIQDLPSVVYGIYQGDFDSDGVLDIAASNNNGRKINIIINDVVLDINDTNLQVLKIYPNPTSNELTLQSNNNIISDYVIINNLGQKIISSSLDLSKKINVSTLEAGLYFLKLNNYSETFKFIKE